VRNGEEYAHVYPLLTRLDSMKNNNNSNNYKVLPYLFFLCPILFSYMHIT
jgi:hypothetical protein